MVFSFIKTNNFGSRSPKLQHMKKHLLSLIGILTLQFLIAQPCGNSGNSVCVPSGTLVLSGFNPSSENLPSFPNGISNNTNIQFKNFNQFSFGGQIVTVQSLKIDTIKNLPSGLCWASNKSNDTYANQEDGCIKFTGTPCDSPGQYKLYIVVTANIGVPIQTNGDAVGLKYFLRVVNPGQTAPPVDTNATAPFVSYGYSASCSANLFTASLGSGQTVCNGTQISLSPTLANGQAPYSYAWSSAGNNLSCNNCSAPTATITQNSSYSVTVTDANNNTATASKTVTVNSPTISNFQITASGPTSLCGGGSVTLNAGSGFVNYSWNTGSQSQTITTSQTGNYSVTVLGTDGCTYSDAQSVNVNSSFTGQQICIVSVDPVSGKNVIVWEKVGGFGIDSFKVYRETTIANQYQLIRQQAFGNFSTYEDGQSNPQQSSSRYMITTVDACGESSYSTPHKTIHLTSNVGINNEVNLIWNAYEGISYPSFNIYRGNTQSSMTQLTQVSSGTTSYTDLLPPSPPLYYQIEVINPQGCVPTAKTESYSSSISNIVQISTTGLSSLNNGEIEVYCFYDNAINANTIKLNSLNNEPKEIILYDLIGRKIFSADNFTTQEVNIPKEITSGVYMAEIVTDLERQVKRIFVR